jgi:hypothetical protein
MVLLSPQTRRWLKKSVLCRVNHDIASLGDVVFERLLDGMYLLQSSLPCLLASPGLTYKRRLIIELV